MEKKQNHKLESGLSVKSKRYWSIMLVGEHGRVVPFRRFKEVVIAVASLIVLSLSALLVLSILYTQQSGRMNRLQGELDELRGQSGQLKDERDVLRAKLVIQELDSEPDRSKAAPKENAKAGAPPANTASPTPAGREQSRAKPAPKEKPAPPAIKWNADIKQFKTKYDHQREILRTTFRIYNTSKPRKRLTGRIVIAYKHSDDPPIKWLKVPNVPLKDGKPAIYAGQAFSIRNYQTMDFKAYKPPTPTAYEMVTVFVLLSNGDLLMSREFGIEIKGPPPAPPPAPAARPTPTKTSPEKGVVPGKAPAAVDEPAGQQENVAPPTGPAKTEGAHTGSAADGVVPSQDGSSGITQDAPDIPPPSIEVPDVPKGPSEDQRSTVETQSKPEGETQ